MVTEERWKLYYNKLGGLRRRENVGSLYIFIKLFSVKYYVHPSTLRGIPHLYTRQLWQSYVWIVT